MDLILRISRNYVGKHDRLVRYETLAKSYVHRTENSAQSAKASYTEALDLKNDDLAGSLKALNGLVFECKDAKEQVVAAYDLAVSVAKTPEDQAHTERALLARDATEKFYDSATKL